MALSHAQLQTAAYLAQQVYQQRPDWLAQTVSGTLYIAIEGTDEASGSSKQTPRFPPPQAAELEGAGAGRSRRL